MGVRNKRDLVDLLKGTAETEQILVETGVNGLYMVDSYHKRVLMSNVVQSPRYKEFIDTAGHHFDYILLDTPPVGMFIDSAVLARVADRTVAGCRFRACRARAGEGNRGSASESGCVDYWSGAKLCG